MKHCVFRDGNAAWEHREKYTDAPRELKAHLRALAPQWASSIIGMPVEIIEEFAVLIGLRKLACFRLGYSFARSRNSPTKMHAASCITTEAGAWTPEGVGSPPRLRAGFSIQPSTRRRLRAPTKKAVDGDDLPATCSTARHRRRRYCRVRQHTSARTSARSAVRRRALRFPDRGVKLAELGLPGALRHQHADRRGAGCLLCGGAFHDNKVWVRRHSPEAAST